MKRAAVLVLGAALVVRGLRRRSRGGVATAVAGGLLLSLGLDAPNRIESALRSRAETVGGSDGGTEATHGAAVSRTVTIGRPADDLYESFRDPATFSRAVGDFADVTVAGEDRLRWTVQGPRDRNVSWETRIVEDVPGEFFRWETPADATLPNEGAVGFHPAPGDRGTEVTLSLRFDPPGGTLGTAALRRLDVVPEAIVATALRRFKSLVESGEIQTLEGNPSARGTGDLV